MITRPFFLSESVPDSTCTDACRRQGGTTCRVSLALRLHTMMAIGCKCWEGCFGFFSPPCRRRLEADKTGLSFFEPFVHGRACPSQVTCDFARRPITRIVGHVCHPGSFGRTSSFLGSVFAGGFAVVGSHQRNLSSVESTWDEVPVRGATMYGILFFCKSLNGSRFLFQRSMTRRAAQVRSVARGISTGVTSRGTRGRVGKIYAWPHTQLVLT